MAPLVYRTDMDAVRERLRTFWGGGDIGRPALLLTCPREVPLERIERPARPPGWITDYSTTDYGYRVALSDAMVADRCYFAEAVPAVVPVLAEMTERVSYSMYHWDGPGAIPHHDHLLGLERLDMIQWTPGSGHPPVEDRTWWPLYHKTVEAGKMVHIGGVSLEGLRAMAREFGPKLRRFLIGMGVRDERAAGEAIAVAEG